MKDNLKEFELLRFSFDGARIFFNDVGNTIPNDKQANASDKKEEVPAPTNGDGGGAPAPPAPPPPPGD